MKTDFIYLYRYHNEEHFQFGEDLIELITKAGADKLKVLPQFNAFVGIHRQEDEVLEQIRKSDLSGKLHDADMARDATFRGMTNVCAAALDHFQPSVASAARRIQIVLDTFGNIARLNYAKETGAAHNFVTELMQKHEDDVRLLGLDVWAEELLARNKVVAGLLRERDTEYTEQTDLRVKEVRKQADDACRTLIVLVEALGVVADAQKSEDAEMYKEFIRSLNQLIERYNTILAQRKGRAAAKKKKEEEQKPVKPAPPTGGE